MLLKINENKWQDFLETYDTYGFKKKYNEDTGEQDRYMWSIILPNDMRWDITIWVNTKEMDNRGYYPYEFMVPLKEMFNNGLFEDDTEEDDTTIIIDDEE